MTKKLILIPLFTLCLFVLSPSYGAEEEKQLDPSEAITNLLETLRHSQPAISATHYQIVDLSTGQILAQQHAHTSKAPASLTKLLTALVVLDKLDLKQEITVSFNATNIEPNKMYLYAGEKIRVEALLSGLLIASANDAAVALAEAVSGTEQEFAELMNQKARQLGLENSNFKNASGLDANGHTSSASDINKLALEALKQPFIKKAVKTKKKTVHSSDDEFSHHLTSTNKLLDKSGVKGVKTGYTGNAGQALSFIVERNEREVLAVLLGSKSRFVDGEKIIDWVYDHHTWHEQSIPACSFSMNHFLLTANPRLENCKYKKFTHVTRK